jgi:hypothetical protein
MRFGWVGSVGRRRRLAFVFPCFRIRDTDGLHGGKLASALEFRVYYWIRHYGYI